MSFKVRSNGTIRVPYGISGEWEVEVNHDGSFTYRSVGNNEIKLEKTMWVVADLNGNKERSFYNEGLAVNYKDAMELRYGRVCRIKKVFNSNGCKTLEV